MDSSADWQTRSRQGMNSARQAKESDGAVGMLMPENANDGKAGFTVSRDRWGTTKGR